MDVDSRRWLADEIPGTFYGTAWSNDCSTLFYVTVDQAWRPDTVWRHTIGTPAAEDVVVYREDDERFWVAVGLTRSNRYIVVDTHSKITSEVRVISADQPRSAPVVVATRRQGVEYSVEHHGDRLLILHNDNDNNPRPGGAENFALAHTSADSPGAWTPLIDPEPDVRLLDVAAFGRHLVVSLRRDGLTGLRVIPVNVGAEYDVGSAYDIDFPEPVYSVEAGANPEYDTGDFRLTYASLVTPDSVYDANCSSYLVSPPRPPTIR